MKLLFERILLEKHERSTAADRLAKSGMFGDPNDPKAMEEATKFIDKLSRGTRDAEGNVIYPKIPAFDGAKGWALKYILGVARMILEESGGDLDKAEEFINNTDNMSAFDTFIAWVIKNRPAMGDPNKPDAPSKEQLNLDDQFINKMSFSEVVDKAEEIRDELDNTETDMAGSMENSDYEIIPIDSYEQLNHMFGGRKTGRGGTSGSGIGYATADGGAWCHTNGKGTYDSWVEDGKYKFFILAKKDWQDIQPDFSNYGKNDYGHSLMALLVDTKNGRLVRCTLRVNHEGIDGGGFGADHAYETYAELSEIAGFDVGKVIKDMLGIKPIKIKNGTIEYAGGVVSNMDGFDPEKTPQKIKRVIVKDGVTRIEQGAFEGLTALEVIEIPSSVTYIGGSAFRFCESLTNITLPDSITEIGPYAFNGCKSLTSINIPEGIKEIRNDTFVASGITSISIPDSVELLGVGVFAGCKALTSAKLSNGCIAIPSETFAECVSLQEVVIGTATSEIGNNAFAYCKDLVINLPDSVSTVSRNAFNGCENVVINTATPRVFRILSNKRDNDIEATGSCGFTVNYTAMDDSQEVEHVVYRGEKLSIQYGDRISEIKYVTIPKGISTIENYSFKDCVNLLGFTDQSDLSNINSIDDGAFENCERLVALDLHQMTNLWWLGKGAFKNCKSIGYIGLPEGDDGPQDIPNECFQGCTSLSKVDCNNITRIIGNSAFRESGVVTVAGLDKVTEIGDYAFADCVNLRALALNSPRLRRIGEHAFDGCTSLEGIYCTNDNVERFCNDHNIPCVRTDREGR